MNRLKVLVLMAGLTALFIAVGSLVGGDQGMVIALALAAAINLGLYFSSSSQVNPLAAHGGGIATLFSTHPPIGERIARLQRMGTAQELVSV